VTNFLCIDDFNDILLELLCLTIAGLLVSWLFLSSYAFLSALARS
jgi:hypothetical protein